MPQIPPPARLILTATSAAIGGTVAWWHWRGPWLAALAILTAALLVLAVLAPRAYAPVFVVLDGIVRHLLQGFTWLLLGLVFLLVFVPGRIVLAVRRHDPLMRRPDPTRATYWHEIARANKNAAARFRAQF